jgi:hypothetical protein
VRQSIKTSAFFIFLLLEDNNTTVNNIISSIPFSELGRRGGGRNKREGEINKGKFLL